MSVKIKLQGHGTLRQQLRALTLAPGHKKQLYFRLARDVIRESRQRTRAQKEIDGSQFAPRKNGNKKVLRKILRTARVVKSTPRGATAGWPNSLTGRIASAQQHGITERHTAASAARAARKRGEPDYSAPATTLQARALIAEGYKRYSGKFKSGKKAGQSKGKRVSARWITENLTVGQAGLILRLLRDKQPKQSWQTVTPARPFLGVNRQQIPEMSRKIIHEITTNARRAGA